MNPRLRTLGLAVAAMLVAACNQSPALIDRTEPNEIKKTDLLSGTWYVQSTIVDVPPTSPLAVVGYPSALEKVRFEIQEDYLVAYRTYEWVPGTDPTVDQQRSILGNTVTLDGQPYRGAPVAAWTIVKHFDRQRQYNAATGEQTNILVEDTQDRPWYEREFIRVNWATNSIVNFLDMYPSGATLVRWIAPENDNTEDDAFFTEYVEKNGKKELAYFDFTLRAIFDPPTFYYPGYGRIPYCWLNPRMDCESAEIEIRTSVRRIDEAHVLDYEPLVYGDKLETKFGYFRTDRVTYDRNRGVTESGRLTYANRHDIWEHAHEVAGACNAAGLCADGFACEAGLCRKPIPVDQRTPKPVVYYLSSNWPQDLMDAAKGIEESWDWAFRRAVAVPRGLEVNDVPQMFYVCQNPVPEGAPAACGPQGLTVRLGDLRYNQIPWIDQPQLAGPLGLGPSAADPETGEIIQGVANIYGAGIDAIAGSTQQVVDVLNGDLALEDLISGKDIRDYVFEHLNPTDPRRQASGPATSGQPLVSDPQRPAASFAGIRGTLKAQIDAAKTKGHLPLFRQDRREVVDQLIANNPALESELINLPEVRAMVLASAPNAELRRKLESDASLFRTVARQTMLNLGELKRLQRERLEKAARINNGGCLYLAEFADDHAAGMAKDMKKLFDAKSAELLSQGHSAAEAKKLARNTVYNHLRNALTRHIGEHEVGHTLGLTHNFIGSFDALNYKDGYWDLRKDTIGVMVGGQRVLPLSPQNLLDATRQNQMQIDARMADYQYSSIMDYSMRFWVDRGIGKYDQAAILFAYAGGGEPGWVEVFNETRGKTPRDYENPNVAMPTDNLAKQLVVRGAHTEIPLAHVQHYTPVSNFYTDRFHYTTLPFHFADTNQTFEQMLDQGVKRMGNRSYRKWSELEALYDKLEKVYFDWQRNLGSWNEPDWTAARDIVGRTAPGMPVEVPYMYCSDYEVGAHIACNRWDFGADVFEVTNEWITRYQEDYVFNAFKRDRFGFGPDSYWNRIDRYTMNLPNVYQQWLFNIFWLQDYYDLTAEQMEQYFGVGDPIFQNYWTMAVIDGTNTLLRQLATPSTGYHGKLPSGSWVHLSTNKPDNARLPDSLETNYIQSTLAQGFTDVVYVPRGPGRSMYTLFESDGYDFFTRVNEVGHFWDQVMAISALASSSTNFLGVDRGSDALRYSLPYYMTFDRELSNVYGAVWSEDRSRYGSSLVKTGNGLATVVSPQFVRGEDFIADFNYPPPPPRLLDGSGSALPMEKVEASPTWGTRFYAQVYGMAFFTENFNQDFASQNQVYRLGSGEQITPAAGYSVVQFADPFGGYIYAAVKKDNDPAPPPAPQIILTAQQYKANWDLAAASSTGTYQGLTTAQWEAKTRELVRSLEIMRGLYNIFGRAI